MCIRDRYIRFAQLLGGADGHERVPELEGYVYVPMLLRVPGGALRRRKRGIELTRFAVAAAAAQEPGVDYVHWVAVMYAVSGTLSEKMTDLVLIQTQCKADLEHVLPAPGSASSVEPATHLLRRGPGRAFRLKGKEGIGEASANVREGVNLPQRLGERPQLDPAVAQILSCLLYTSPSP